MEHPVVSRDAWRAARKELLRQEKEFTRERDRLSAQRRALPWVEVDEAYVFDGPAGRETLADLFDGRSQLIVYHFMFGPDWQEGCQSCSLLADHFDGAIVHLAQRFITRHAQRHRASPPATWRSGRPDRSHARGTSWRCAGRAGACNNC